MYGKKIQLHRPSVYYTVISPHVYSSSYAMYDLYKGDTTANRI